MNEKEKLRIMLENSISSARGGLEYASEMLHATTSCLDLPRIDSSLGYLEVAQRRTKDAIKFLKKWRKR